jgi:putative PIN family toxin of toxin-antitoxin system
MLRIFIDTNVWFSAFYGSQNAERLIKAHINKKIQAVISQQVLDELVNNMRAKIPSALPHLEKLFAAIPPEITKNPETISLLIKQTVNPKDQSIFQAVLDSKIKFFVTGNLKHFKAEKIRRQTGVKILNPAQTLSQL